MHLVGGLVHGAGDIVLGAEGVDGLNVLGSQGEVEAVQVALNARGGQALGQNNVASSSVPVEQDLGSALVVLLGNGVDCGVFKLVTTSQGRVSLDLNAVLVAKLDESLALAEGVNFDLVDSGNDGGILEKVLDVGSTEVRNTNGLDLAELLGSLESTPALKALLLILGRGVDQIQVKVVEAELVQRVAKSVEGSFVAVISIPELGADENILTRGAGLLEPGADSTTTSLLVGISSSRVDVAVASLEGSSDSVLSLLAVRSLVYTKSNLGNRVAVVQLDGSD